MANKKGAKTIHKRQTDRSKHVNLMLSGALALDVTVTVPGPCVRPPFGVCWVWVVRAGPAAVLVARGRTLLGTVPWLFFFASTVPVAPAAIEEVVARSAFDLVLLAMRTGAVALFA